MYCTTVSSIKWASLPNLPPGVCNWAVLFHTLFIVMPTLSTNGIYLSIQHNGREGASLFVHVSQRLPAVLKQIIPTDVVK